VLIAELVIRAALVYIVVALAPLVFAAQLWPAMRGIGRKLLELVVALILSKLVIAVALSVAAAAMVGTGSGGEVTALPPPEVTAEDPGGSVTQAVGILLAAVAAFGVAAFSPLLITRLMPLTEAALVAQGLRGGPLRAGQQAMSLGYYSRVSGNRISQVAGARPGLAASGAGAGAAAAAAGAGVRAASQGARNAAERATTVHQPGRSPSSGASRPRRPPPGSGGSSTGGDRGGR
jgi:hypothetical protein